MNEKAAEPGRPADDGAGRTADDGAPELALMKQWAMDQMPVPLTLCDRHTIRLAVNTAMTRVLGLPEDELVGVRLGRDAAGERLPPLDNAGDAAERALRTGEPVTFETHSQARGDPHPHAWMIWVYPV